MKLNDTQIYLNMFVHYPEIYNANTISNHLIKYINDSDVFKLINNPQCYVMINSAPHSEEELIKVEINIDRNNVTFINKDKLTATLNNFVENFFNNRIKVINVEFILL